MIEFFKHFPPELSEGIAIKMMELKLHQAYEKCEDDDASYIEDLEKVKDMIELFLQEVS